MSTLANNQCDTTLTFPCVHRTTYHQVENFMNKVPGICIAGYRQLVILQYYNIIDVASRLALITSQPCLGRHGIPCKMTQDWFYINNYSSFQFHIMRSSYSFRTNIIWTKLHRNTKRHLLMRHTGYGMVALVQKSHCVSMWQITEHINANSSWKMAKYVSSRKRSNLKVCIFIGLHGRYAHICILKDTHIIGRLIIPHTARNESDWVMHWIMWYMFQLPGY